jgi:hypothetical protein
MAVIFFCLEVPDRETTSVPWTQKLLQLDGLGTASLIPCVVSLLLALQWGGQKYDVSFLNDPKLYLTYLPLYDLI